MSGNSGFSSVTFEVRDQRDGHVLARGEGQFTSRAGGPFNVTELVTGNLIDGAVYRFRFTHGERIPPLEYYRLKRIPDSTYEWSAEPR